MAEASSRTACVDRHRHYHIDIAGRLGGPRALQRRRIEAMVRPIRDREEVLDVGCNSGYVVDFLPRKCRVSGVDVAEQLVQKARQRLVRAEVAEAEELPFRDLAFDVVILGEILEHVHDPVRVLREAARVARRLVVGSTPHPDGKWGAASVHAHRFHVRCYNAETLTADLGAAGLRNPRIEVIRRSPGDVGQMWTFSAEK